MAVTPWWVTAQARRRGRRTVSRPLPARFCLEALEDRLAPAVFTVTNTADSGNGSLRKAVTDANSTPGLDTIQFAVGSGGAQTITLLTPLPDVTEAVLIDGETQPGFAGSPLIAVDGGMVADPSADGLVLAADGCTVQGLSFINWKGTGITVVSDGNTVQRDDFGVTPTGIAAGNGFGVYIGAGGANNQVATNLITSNRLAGVQMDDPGTTGNSVRGNVIANNLMHGVLIQGGASNNMLGGDGPALGNDIRSNGGFGIVLVGETTTGNVLAANRIGAAGAPGGGNAQAGIFIGAPKNTVGVSGLPNVIVGNASAGVVLSGHAATGNVVTANLIGIDPNGTPRANRFGVFIEAGASGNTVGGNLAGSGNVISGNQVAGVVLEGAGTTGNVVAGNRIGTDAAGAAAVGNLFGVFIDGGASSNTVGSAGESAGNVISGNLSAGVSLLGPGTSGNFIVGNRIGTDLTGTKALGNLFGVYLQGGASGNTVGGTATNAGNVISGNQSAGVVLRGGGTSRNAVAGNRIGTDAAGQAAVGNRFGVYVEAGASFNTVGGPGTGNLVSGNLSDGVVLTGVGTTGNLVAGNRIGVNLAGTGPLPNLRGVQIGGGAVGNTLGGSAAGAGNVIARNTAFGVLVVGASGNALLGNLITLNGSHGIFVTNLSSGNTIGGPYAGAGNTVTGNAGTGVLVGSDPAGFGPETAGAGNAIEGNSIDANGRLGIDLGPNDGVTAGPPQGSSGGPNNFQSFPTLNSASVASNGTLVSGSLHSRPNTPFRLDFYANPQPDPSGFGEGKTFLGTAVVVTDAAGNVTFQVRVSGATAPGQFVTATATDPGGNTSEFSRDVAVG
jgi:hypothetical protein